MTTTATITADLVMQQQDDSTHTAEDGFTRYWISAPGAALNDLADHFLHGYVFEDGDDTMPVRLTVAPIGGKEVGFYGWPNSKARRL